MVQVQGIGALLVALGFIGFVYGMFMRVRASRVADAPFVKTGEAASKGTAAANPKGAISAEGNVSCAQPLQSPVSGKTCLFYEVKVTASWKDGETHKTKEIAKERRAAQFAIDDGSGPVWVDAREGGDFEPQEEMSQTKTPNLLGGITGQDLMFGQYRVSTGMLSMGTKYQVEEKILPAVPRLYACGKVGSSNEITAPSWRSLLLTSKSREDYLGHAMKSAKIALIVAGSLTGVGAIMGVVGTVGASHDHPAAAASASSQPAAGTDTAAATATANATAAQSSAAKPGTTAPPAKGAAPPAPKKKK
jgi:hypothetical protein